MALALLEFVKHNDPGGGRVNVLQKIEEPFEQVGIVFTR